MTHYISRDQHFFGMSKDNKPVLTVELGDSVEFDTNDAFNGQIKSESDSLGEFDWNAVNQATGPVFINGIKPGDVLKVTINDIDIDDVGTMLVGPDLGVTGKYFDDMKIRRFNVNFDNNTVDFDGIEIPINKMVGVIGVAPEEGVINNGTPCRHGGNMDSVKITEGAVLYLPVFHEGALFGLGDCHAAMADGEICVTGVEIGAKVNVTLEKAEFVQTGHPMVVDKDGTYMFYSDESLDKAVDESVHEMIKWILPQTDMDIAELSMLLSLVGSTEINQVVDPKKTARFFVPHYVLDALGVKIG